MSNPIGFLSPEYRPVVKRFISFPPADLLGLSERLSVGVASIEQAVPLSVHFMDGFNIVYLSQDMRGGVWLLNCSSNYQNFVGILESI